MGKGFPNEDASPQVSAMPPLRSGTDEDAPGRCCDFSPKQQSPGIVRKAEELVRAQTLPLAFSTLKQAIFDRFIFVGLPGASGVGGIAPPVPPPPRHPPQPPGFPAMTPRAPPQQVLQPRRISALT